MTAGEGASMTAGGGVTGGGFFTDEDNIPSVIPARFKCLG